MRNVKITVIIKSIYGNAWKEIRDKLQTTVAERKHIIKKDVKKKKDEDK
jgi:hypothetical protein